jgi:hypothetical protein
MNEIELKQKTSSIIKKIVSTKKLPRAFKYDLYLRDFDNKVEVIGQVEDPTLSLSDFKGRESVFPKKWVTLDVLSISEVESYVS